MAINVADNFSYQGGKPLDARMKFDTVNAMVNTPVASLYDGCFAYVTATKKYYSYDSSNTSDPTLGKWTEYSSGGGGTSDYDDLTDKPQINSVTLSGNKTSKDLGIQETQKSTMPTASSENVGQIVQYIGASSASYTKGYYYQCVENSGVYSWANIAVQPVSGFDYSNEFGAENIMSLTEKMIGQWIDGKPLYQKTIVTTTPSTLSSNVTVCNLPSDIDKVVYLTGFFIHPDTNDSYKPIEFYVSEQFHVDTQVRMDHTPPSIQMYLSYNTWRDLPLYITIRYTKTTDSAMSIGTPNDYSTTEKIVGTWTDGKPLWQKTFDTTTPANGTDTLIAELPSNCIAIGFDGYILQDGYNRMPLNCYYANGQYVCTYIQFNPSNGIRMKCEYVSLRSSTAIITVRYTKTT